jgi:hypothetical protein
MKRLLLAAAAFAAGAAVAYADPYAGYYGNTVNITNPDGKTDKAFVNPDKTWERRNTDGSVMKGSYEVNGDGKSACFAQTEPTPPAEQKPACFPTDNRKAGDTWETKDDKGAVTKWSITAGR